MKGMMVLTRFAMVDSSVEHLLNPIGIFIQKIVKKLPQIDKVVGTLHDQLS